MYKIYLRKGEENDATAYYIGIIKEAILKKGGDLQVVYAVKDILPADIVITVNIQSYLQVYLNNRKQCIVNWFQGILPEEIACNEKPSFRKYLKMVVWTIFERFAVHNAHKVFFVSNAMRLHYQRKYGYCKKNYFIMPCFNMDYERQEDSTRYEKMTFVYAGSLAKWQCIDETLALFREIKMIYPSAKLSLLTAEKAKALDLLEQYGLKNEVVKYVNMADLATEMSQYKYGFLIREDIPVNNVATPTKMNSYMAAGILPICVDVVHDFKSVFSGMSNMVYGANAGDCIEKIKKIEKEGVNLEQLNMEYEDVFSTYYSRVKYVDKISMFLDMD